MLSSNCLMILPEQNNGTLFFFCAHVFNDETFVSFVISGALVGSALQLDITLRL